MDLSVEKQVEDIRGKILICSYGKNHVNLVEIKKGFARGGHYHPYPQNHILISGKIEYREENIVTNEEQITIIDKPTVLFVPVNTAHLLIAFEDTIFAETFDEEYDAKNYPKYRKIVEERMNS